MFGPAIYKTKMMAEFSAIYSFRIILFVHSISSYSLTARNLGGDGDMHPGGMHFIV